METKFVIPQRRPGLFTSALAAVVLLVAHPGPARGADELPTLAELLKDIDAPATAKGTVLGGEIFHFTPEASNPTELTAGMAFLVDSKPDKLIQDFFDKVGVPLNPDIVGVGEITGDGSLDDFAKLTLTPNGAAEGKKFLDAEAGSDLNLSAGEIEAFKALKAAGKTSQADVEAQIRKMLLARFQAYKTTGLAGITPYARGGDKTTKGGDLLRLASEKAVFVKKYLPDAYDALLHYPQSVPAAAKITYFWINIKIDDRPTLILTQRVLLPVGNGYFLGQRHFYVSRSYNVEQEVGGLLPAQEGTVVVYANRTSTDQVTGFGGSAKRSIGSKVMSGQLTQMWKRLQTKAK